MCRRLLVLVLVFAATLLALSFAPAAWAAAGGLDPSFGVGGTVTTPLVMSAYASRVAVQPDGKVVAAGAPSKSYDAVALARYRRDGSPDPTFGTHGVVSTPLGPGTTPAGVVVQPDRSLVVAGSTTLGTAFVLVRYRPDGSLDHTFGVDGVATTPVDPQLVEASDVVLQPDGKFVVAGTAGLPMTMVLGRFNADGTVDRSFGSDGLVTTALTQFETVGTAIVLEPDGRLIVVGRAAVDSAEGHDFAIVRYNADGSLDRTFGDRGAVLTAIPGTTTDETRAAALQPDGKLVVAGVASGANGHEMAVVRYNTDGSLDRGFGTGGAVLTAVGPFSEASGVGVQPDGKAVVDGLAYPDGHFAFTLVRYNPDGSPDVTFGTDGVITTVPDTSGATARDTLLCPKQCVRDVIMQRDGKILTAGFVSVNGTDDVTLLRYSAQQADSDAAPPPTTPPASTQPAPTSGTIPPATAPPSGVVEAAHPPVPAAPTTAPAPSPAPATAATGTPVGVKSVRLAQPRALPVTGSSARSLGEIGGLLIVSGLFVLAAAGRVRWRWARR